MRRTAFRSHRRSAELAINYRDGDFAPAVQEFTAGRGVAVVVDCIGGKYLASNLACLAPDGRLVIIGLMGGAKAELNLAALLGRRLSVIDSTLRTRSLAEKARLLADFRSRFGEDLGAGRIRPVVDRTPPFSRAADAHRLLQASEHFGKVVLVPDGRSA